MRYSILFILFPFMLDGQELYFPPIEGDTWENIDPETLNYCEDSIAQLYQYLEDNNTKAFILLKDGKIVLEQYFGTFEADSNWYWASAGKTLTAFLVGIAQEDGDLSINDPTSDYLGVGWTNCTPIQEEAILIKHQLSMTTGLDDGAGNFDCTDPSCLGYLEAPGQRWSYHNAPYTLLDGVIENATDQNLNLYLNSKVKNLIGMNGLYLPLGYNNVYYSTPRSMARFGLLLLANGVWDETTILGDLDYLQAMSSTSQDLNKSYGYLTWLNGKESFMIPQLQTVFSGSISPNGPSDAYFALGKNGQIISVVPSENMVWIRMGAAPSSENALVSTSLNDDIGKRINNLTCNTSSINPLTQNGFELFPNPTQDRIQITSEDEMAKVEIYNIEGKLLYDATTQNYTQSIPVEYLEDGMYILTVFYKNGRSGQHKFIKN